MRKKRRLGERLGALSGLIIDDPASLRGRWNEEFGNALPVYLEIGCGKGAFIQQSAKSNPGANYIGLERVGNVIVTAAERTFADNPGNIRYINADARNLPLYFGEGEIHAVYLNFNDPWPKSRYERRRLTHAGFLASYRSILAEGSFIRLKTDNADYFGFSLMSFAENGFRVIKQTRDLYASPYAEDNIATEYENNFTAQGKNIHFAEAVMDVVPGA